MGWRSNYIRRVCRAVLCQHVYVHYAFRLRKILDVGEPGDAAGEFIYSIIEDAIARHCNANFQPAGVEVAEMDGGSAERNITEM